MGELVDPCGPRDGREAAAVAPRESDREALIALARRMLRIRLVERAIEDRYGRDEMKTPIHLCIGQEAVAAGVCARLRSEDYIASNHRGHGHYLAKGGDLAALIAELHCRSTGCSKGHGGSMHLVDASVGHLGSSSIVGGGIPIATGLALAIAVQRQDRVSVAFFGDGAADEGALYESVNFAVLKRLPVVFVLENNQFSVCSRASARQAGAVVFHHMPPELLPSERVDGNDVLAVYEAAGRAVDRARSGGGPSFIECVTYRVRGHAGSGTDAALGYRTEAEIRTWERRDPVDGFIGTLLAHGVVRREVIGGMAAEIEREIGAAFEAALAAPLPRGEEVGNHLFRQ